MAGTRPYTAVELDLVRKSFSGRYALRDRCFFELALATGLRVSESLSITVGQVYQYGEIPDTLSIERRFMKGGKPTKEKPRPADHVDGCACSACKPKRKGPTAEGRTLPVFDETKPYILAWLKCLAVMLHVQDPKAIDPSTPLFCSRVRNKDGSRRAIARETAWRIIKAIARENRFDGKIATHSTRKTLAQQAEDVFGGDIRKVQKILGHKSLSSTEHYTRSYKAEELWQQYHTARGKAA
jgi:site-specific recombinase XerD